VNHYGKTIKHKNIGWQEYVKRFTSEIENNPKAQRALDELARYDGIITLLCHCSDENKCHRSLVKQMIMDRIHNNIHA
jgi:uncharacterized protein YeaO (DUF488 family)